MKHRFRTIAAAVCILALAAVLAACDSAGDLQEKADSLKDAAEQKYNEIAGGFQDVDMEDLDIQDGYFMDDQYVVVVRNLSEDKAIRKFAISYDAFDADDNPLEPPGFPPASTVGPVLPGTSAVMVDWGGDCWTESPARMGYTMQEANFGSVKNPVCAVDLTENYYGNYSFTIKNDGKADADLSGAYNNMKLQFYAVFRDGDGNVTGVSNVFLPEYEYTTDEGYIAMDMPAVPAGGELTVDAEVYDVYPGTIEIALVWNRLSQNYRK